MKEIIYFGCIEQSGHYWFSKLRNRWDLRSNCTPWGNQIDGGLAKTGFEEGIVFHFQKDGWTAIDFCDCSVDSRPGSHSVFAINELITEAELLAAAREQWPEIFARFKFRIQSGSPDTPTVPQG